MLDYYITYKENEKILNINLNFDLEISDFNFNKLGNTKNKILKLAKRINAKKINIIINGIIISTLMLSPAKLKNDYKDTITFLSKNTIKNNFNKYEFEDKIDNTITIKDDVKDKVIINVNNTPKQTSIINNYNNTKKDSTNIKTSSNNNKTSEQNNNITEVNKTSENIITIYRSNGTVLNIELEEYLIGVVASEMPASFNIEALKAQAIVARTYALKRISENKVLTDTVSTQVYKDNSELKKVWKEDYDKYYNKIKNAVLTTKGLVITYNGKLIDAVYHSTSNGMTEDSIYVWDYSLPYLKSVSSEYDKSVSTYKKYIFITYENISKILNTTIDKNTQFILSRNQSNRVTEIKVNDISLNGTTFRNLLGLRSTDFELELLDDNIKITTYGYGHGVGMSQYGANSFGNNGYNYKDILKHYYTGISIKKM